MNLPVKTNEDIRNLAIIAHVDHGKTTLVDALLKQGHVFRDHQQVGELIMDTNPLERERGITILAKNTAVNYEGIKINIIDTPGHADFSGEVERIMNMADGCLLLVDAVDGPMPQTRYVLERALHQDVVPIVIINKIDRSESRVQEVLSMIQDLFLELATKPEQLDFPVLMTSAKFGYAVESTDKDGIDMRPLFEAIIREVPAPKGDPEGPFTTVLDESLIKSKRRLLPACVGIPKSGARLPSRIILVSLDVSEFSHLLFKILSTTIYFMV